MYNYSSGNSSDTLVK